MNMFTLIIAVGIIGVSFVYYHLTFGKYQRDINKIPGPPTRPIIGNAHGIGKDPAEIFKKLCQWWKQYGKDKFRIWISSHALVYLTDPKDIENILSSTKTLQKSHIYTLLHPWLGQGLLTSHGPLWRSHRKMITPSFHFKILVEFFDTINANTSKFVQKLEDISKGDRIFDFQNLTCFFTLDVICETAMGVSVNAMDDNDSDLTKAFKYMCFSIQMRGFNPIKRNQFLFKFTPEYSRYKNALKTLKDFTMEVISKRRQAMQNAPYACNNKDDADDIVNARRKKAFLDTLLTTTINGRPLTDKEIFEEVSTFMFAGHDTTSSVIAFAIYLLSRHPEAQNKVFEEQLQIFNGDLTRQPVHRDIQEMKYLDMFIKEAQRIFPSVPFIGRLIEETYDMNGTILPKGTTINVFIYAMGHNEKYFPDPYKFDPERFNSESQRVKLSPYVHVPFSAGPRNCIGQKFAMLELKTVIAKIVRTFKILPPEDGLYSKDGYEPKEPTNKYDPILFSIITLKSENGIKIRLQKRTV